MRIAIVGGGSSALAMYIALRIHLPTPPSSQGPHSSTVFEAYDKARRDGSKAVPLTATLKPDKNPKLEDGNARTGIKPTNAGGGLGVAPNGIAILSQMSRSLHLRVLSAGFPTERIQIKSAGNWSLGALETT